jgi:protein ImuB
MALFFPHLATDRIRRLRHGRSWRSKPGAGRDDAPLAIFTRENNAFRIAALDEKAETLGLQRGTGLADARAMHPALETLEEDAVADQQFLSGIADWCDRYTPLVALDHEGGGLFLDITGCAHLFGGEKAMLADVLARLFEQGIDTRAGLASTPGAAWASARFGHERVIAPGKEADAIAPLPMPALRLSGETVAGLDRLGLRTAGMLLSAPRAPLARRFGAEIMLRLDQALGRVEEALSPRLPVPELSAERRFAEPVGAREDIERLVFMLAGTLRDDLERRGLGARALELALFRVDGEVSRIAIGTSRPLRDAGVVRRLFRERLGAIGDELDAGYGYELVRLSVLADARLDAMQEDLSGDAGISKEDMAELADRIRARLGGAALVQPVLHESHVPERAVRHVPFGETKHQEAGKTGSDATLLAPDRRQIPKERPLRLFTRPEPVEAVAQVPDGPPVSFRWRRALYRVARAEGPERIEGEWWLEDDAPQRDYFRVEDEAGRRYWLFRQGAYAAGAAMPGWFMQGVFP